MDEPAQEPQQYCLRWNNHQSTIVSIFDTLYRTEALVDCQIAVEGGIVYKAHRVVLSACSPYFADLLKTYNEQMYPTIVVCGIGANEIEAIMSYMYRGEVNISQERLPSLLRIAEFLKIKGLSESNASRGTAHHQQQPQQLPGNPNKRQRISSVPGIESEAAGQDEAISPRRRRRGIRRRSHDNNDNSNSSAVQDSLVHHNAPGSAQLGTISLTGNASTASAYSAMPHYAAASLGLSASALSAQAPLASSPLSVSVTKKTESGKSGTGAASDTTNVQTAKLANAAIDEHNQDSAITKNTVDKSSSSAANHQKLSKSATLASGSNTASSNNNREPSTSAAAAQLGTEMVIEPKAEYVEDANEENVEDLTLDDEDMATGMDDMDQAAGTSQAGEGSSQGYANWQHERSNQDDLVLATQEGQQRDPQGKENANLDLAHLSEITIGLPAEAATDLKINRKLNKPEKMVANVGNVEPATNAVIDLAVSEENEEEPLRPRLATNPTISVVNHEKFYHEAYQKLQQRQRQIQQQQQLQEQEEQQMRQQLEKQKREQREREQEEQREREQRREYERSMRQMQQQLEEQQRLQKQFAEAQANLAEQQSRDMAMAAANGQLNVPNPAMLAQFLRLIAQTQPALSDQLPLPLAMPIPPTMQLPAQLQIQIPQLAAAVNGPKSARDITNGEILKSLLTRPAGPAQSNAYSPQTFNHNGFSNGNGFNNGNGLSNGNGNGNGNGLSNGLGNGLSNGNGFMGTSSSTPNSQQLRTVSPHMQLTDESMNSIDNNDNGPSGSGMGNRGEKEGKFPCHCGKVYKWKSTLRRHITQECGNKEPQNKCPYCSHASKQRGNLGVHVRKHHPNMPPLSSRRKLKRDGTFNNSGNGSGANLNDSAMSYQDMSFQNGSLDLTNNSIQYALDYLNTTNNQNNHSNHNNHNNQNSSNSDGSLDVSAAHGAQSTLVATVSVVHENGASEQAEDQRATEQDHEPVCVLDVKTE